MSEAYQSKTTGYFEAERREMLPFVPANARRVLDLGCGSGNFGALLKQEYGCEVVGVEHHPTAAGVAAERLDEVVIGSVDAELPFPDASFDCIVMNDVLEHLLDPWRVVSQAARLLKPGGCIVASIPNMRHYRVLKALIQDQQWVYVEKGVLDRTHLRFFTHRTIRAMFENAGYVVERLEGINGVRRFPPKYAILNWLSLGGLEDARYLQFACVARLPLAASGA